MSIGFGPVWQVVIAGDTFRVPKTNSGREKRAGILAHCHKPCTLLTQHLTPSHTRPPSHFGPPLTF